MSAAVTPSRGSTVDIVTWIAVVVSSFSTIVKIYTRYDRTQRIHLDDCFIILALLFAIVEGVAVNRQYAAGLGQHEKDLPTEQFQNVEKAGFAAQILYIPAVYFANMTTLQLVRLLTPNPTNIRTANIGILATSVWSLVSLFGVAFQCDLPQPWAIYKSERCFNQLAFWSFIEGCSVLIDILLVLLPIWIVLWMKIKPWPKVSLMVPFMLRFIPIPMSILRLVFYARSLKAGDQPFSTYASLLVMQIQINIVIIVTCVPFMKTFIDGLHHYGLTSNLNRSTAETTTFGDIRRKLDFSTLKTFSSKAAPDTSDFFGGQGRPGDSVINAYADKRSFEYGDSGGKPGSRDVVIHTEITSTLERSSTSKSPSDTR